MLTSPYYLPRTESVSSLNLLVIPDQETTEETRDEPDIWHFGSEFENMDRESVHMAKRRAFRAIEWDFDEDLESRWDSSEGCKIESYLN